MIKPVVKDTIFLGQKSEEATRADLAISDDLRDTLAENREHCVGMAARRIHRMRQMRAVSLSLAQERPRDIRI